MGNSIKYLLCTVGGVAIGYFFAHGRLEQAFQDKLEQETDEIREYYKRRYIKKAAEEGEDPEFTQAALDAAEAMRKSYEGTAVPPAVLTEEMTATVRRAVDRGDLDISDEDVEEIKKGVESDVSADLLDGQMTKREMVESARVPVPDASLVEKTAKPPAVNYNRISTPPKSDKPAEIATDKEETKDPVNVEVITKQAFIDNQFGYDQQSLTYFAGDDILTNEEDEPITGSRAVLIGAENTKKIKVGREAMGGEDTIYVRNHTGQWEFEITRSEGKFSEEVIPQKG